MCVLFCFTVVYSLYILISLQQCKTVLKTLYRIFVVLNKNKINSNYQWNMLYNLSIKMILISLLWHFVLNIIIINSGTTAHFGPRPSSETFAIRPCLLRHSSNVFPPTSWHHPSLHLPILIQACPFAFFLLLLQQRLFLRGSGPPVG